MSILRMTFIDVGWGDSILLECTDADGSLPHLALIDSNDSANYKSSYIFVKRYIEKLQGRVRSPVFDFVLLTHAHSDHANGLQAIMRDYPTRWFWYPKSGTNSIVTKLIRYANRYPDKIQNHQAIRIGKDLATDPENGGGGLGAARLKALWPPDCGNRPAYSSDENNNSVVLAVTLDKVSFILTGDCEAENWKSILPTLPRTGLRVFKVPHHGAQNGMFDRSGEAPWLDHLGVRTNLVISSHLRPFSHPHARVVEELKRRNSRVLRTDQHHHVTFETDGRHVSKTWTH